MFYINSWAKRINSLLPPFAVARVSEATRGEEDKSSSSPFAIARVFKVAPQFLARVELLKERLAG